MKFFSQLLLIARKIFSKIRGKKPVFYAFEGWGMFTHTNPPWKNAPDALTLAFLEAQAVLLQEITENRIYLSQFGDKKYETLEGKKRLLQGFMWRHFIVFWSARYASTHTKSGSKVLVECGVCDGLTVFFAMRAQTQSFHAYLYDAWDAMKEEYLAESEKKNIGAYDYLSLETTVQNLKMFEGSCTFIKGYIPESLKDAPETLSWLHIDLNASQATLDSLRTFYDRLENGGVILFDDYDWVGYEDTKLLIDRFFEDKKGMLLPLPTGQAIYFKREESR